MAYRRKHWLALLPALSLVACASDGASDFESDDDGFGGSFGDAGASGVCFSSNECPTGTTCNEFGQCVPPSGMGPDGGPPEENELEVAEPIHSDRYVYVALSELDALAKIDGDSLEVSSIPVGDQPEVLAAIPDSDGVVVLDRNNGTVTIVRPGEDADDTRVLPTLPNMNRISIDPTGRYALAWFDIRDAAQGGLGSLADIGSFQDVTLIRLGQNMEHSVDLTVGFRPRSVRFDAAGERAFVITDDGISVLDMDEVISGGPTIVAPVSIGQEAGVDPIDYEVNVNAGGDLAVIRQAGSTTLRFVELQGSSAGQTVDLEMSAAPTDVDLSGDGSRVFVVLRSAAQLVEVDISAGLPSAGDVSSTNLVAPEVGSLVLSADEDQAVLFTNATVSERLLHVDLSSPARTQRILGLKKGVRELGFSPAGTSLLVTHSKSPGSPLDPGLGLEEIIDRSFGYSVVDVPTGFSKLQVTTANPGPFQFSLETP